MWGFGRMDWLRTTAPDDHRDCFLFGSMFLKPGEACHRETPAKLITKGKHLNMPSPVYRSELVYHSSWSFWYFQTGSVHSSKKPLGKWGVPTYVAVTMVFREPGFLVSLSHHLLPEFCFIFPVRLPHSPFSPLTPSLPHAEIQHPFFINWNYGKCFRRKKRDWQIILFQYFS